MVSAAGVAAEVAVEMCEAAEVVRVVCCVVVGIALARSSEIVVVDLVVRVVVAVVVVVKKADSLARARRLSGCVLFDRERFCLEKERDMLGECVLKACKGKGQRRCQGFVVTVQRPEAQCLFHLISLNGEQRHCLTRQLTTGTVRVAGVVVEGAESDAILVNKDVMSTHSTPSYTDGREQRVDTRRKSRQRRRGTRHRHPPDVNASIGLSLQMLWLSRMRRDIFTDRPRHHALLGLPR